MLEIWTCISLGFVLIFSAYCTWKFDVTRFVVWRNMYSGQTKITPYTHGAGADWYVFRFGWHITVAHGWKKGYVIERLGKIIK